MLGIAPPGCGHATKPAPGQPAVRTAPTRGGEDRRMSSLPNGTWGGRGIVLRVTSEGTSVEYDCAHGEIKGQIGLDAEGRFDATGTFVPEGGPVSIPADGAKEKTIKALYVGRVVGTKLTLDVTLPETGGGPGEFTLTHGQEPRLEKCY